MREGMNVPSYITTCASLRNSARKTRHISHRAELQHHLRTHLHPALKIMVSASSTMFVHTLPNDANVVLHLEFTAGIGAAAMTASNKVPAAV